MRKRIYAIVAILLVLLVFAAVLRTDIGCFFAVMATVPDLSRCGTRSQVCSAMPLYVEEQLKPDTKPVWPFLHPRTVGGMKRVPKDLVNCEYHLLGINKKYATVCAAYDKSGRIVGLYEYD